MSCLDASEYLLRKLVVLDLLASGLASGLVFLLFVIRKLVDFVSNKRNSP